MGKLHDLNRELCSAHTGVGFGVIASSKQTVVSVGGWVELDRTTLGVAGDTIDVASLADKRDYMILQNYYETGGDVSDAFRLNGDSGNNYAMRLSANGAGDATSASRNNLDAKNPTTDSDYFDVRYIANLSTVEKLVQAFAVTGNDDGAGVAPNRNENMGKHAQTTNPIDQITSTNGAGGSYAIGSEMVVLGRDPADTHTTNFWEELASENATGSSTNLSSGTITAKKYLWIQCYLKNTTSHTSDMTFNNDTTTYAYRNSNNGAADSTSVSQNDIEIYPATTTPNFVNMFIINNSANEKLVIGHTINQNTVGSGTAPNRREFVGKWDNTASQITEIDIDSSSGNWDSASIIKVWGSN